jgi:competence protein ComEC
MTLKIKIHDVGHGQAVHMFTPNGQTIVIDLGCSSDFSPLKWLCSQTKTIDSLIITHPHGDHIDEILEIDNLGLNVRQLWRPKWLSEQDVRNANQSSYSGKLDCYFEMSNNKFIHPVSESELVGVPSVSGGVSIITFKSENCGTSNINNHSGVVVIEYCGLKIIIPGDNEPASWKILKANQSFINKVAKADIFMASHHGRTSGYCAELFDIFKPKLCIVSDGRVQDTDATDRYSYHATGWLVHSRKGLDSTNRKCLTTRNDGVIDIEVGQNHDGNNFLSISKD